MNQPKEKPRVLHIDDNSDFRSTLRGVLKSDGGLFVDCPDGKSARQYQAGRDYDILVVDSAGFEYAEETRQISPGFPLIVLSGRPELANRIADVMISKNDATWPSKVKDSIRSFWEDTPAPIIDASQKAFDRDLPELLKNHYREWVAYHGEERIGFGCSQTSLFERCLQRGLKDNEFVVRSIEPELRDEDLVFPA